MEKETPSLGGLAERHVISSTEDLWAKALAKFKGEEYTSIQLATGDKRKIIEDILSIVTNAEQTCQQRRWKWKNRKGDVVIIRDVFAKMAVWIQRLKGIGDNVVQYDPAHAALPWAAARFVLQAAINDIETNAAILEGIELVFSLVARFEVIECLYLQRTSKLKPKLQQAIVSLYAAILNFLFKAGRYYSQGSAARMLKSVFQIEDMSTTCIVDIRKKLSEVDEYVKLISAEILEKGDKNMDEATKSLKVLSIQATKLNDIQFHTKEIPVMISEQTRALQSILMNLNQPIHRLASQCCVIDDHLREEERLKIFSWLSEAKYLSHHRSKSKELMPGSGQWLIEKTEFKEWMNSSASSILWLHGIPGSGKSMLVAHVIEYLLNHGNEEKHSVPLAYFYCARNSHEPERSDPTQIMRSLLEQLSCEDEEEPIKFPVVAAYKQRRKEAKGRKPEQLSLDECTNIILELLNTEPAIVVLDGLDECDPKKRQGFLDALQTIIKSSNNVFKIFVSSRDDHDIIHRLSETPNLYIQASDNAEDISRFIVSRVEEAILKERILCGHVSLALKRQIIQVLLGKSNGMFRLPSLHIDSLCDPDRIKTEANIIDALAHLPPDLASSYDVVLDRISRSQHPNPQIARHIMSMILCMGLSSEAFLAGVSFQFQQSGPINHADVLNICNNLVVLDRYSNTFRFAHLSVQEYLQTREDYSTAKSRAAVAEMCLSWLLTNGNLIFDISGRQSTVDNNDPDKLGLTPSATIQEKFGKRAFDELSDHVKRFTMLHTFAARDERKHGNLQKLLRTILLCNKDNPQQDDSIIFTSWMKSYVHTYEISDPPHPIFVATENNFPEIIKELICISPSILLLKSTSKKNCAQIALKWRLFEALKVILEYSIQYNFTQVVRECIYDAGTNNFVEELEVILSVVDKSFVQEEDLRAIARSSHGTFGPKETKQVFLNLLENNKELSITEKVWEAAFLNPYASNVVLGLLEISDEITITNRLLQAIRGNKNSPYHITAALFGSKTTIKCTYEASQELYQCPDEVTFEFLRHVHCLEFPEATFIRIVIESADARDLYLEDDFKSILLRQKGNQLELTWEDVRKLRLLPRCQEYFSLLLPLKPKMASPAINLLIGQWDEATVEDVLAYRKIEITNDIIRAAAGNIHHGEKIMQLLLEREAEELEFET